jgi:hypothetical protein
MEVLYSRCCGLDVHKSSVSACVLSREGGRTQKKYGRYGAMTRDLEELARWLHELGVTHVAMESTGVYWKPVWNVLEGQFHLLLVNAQHVKNVPGRKTDAKDSEWLCASDMIGHMSKGIAQALFTDVVQTPLSHAVVHVHSRNRTAKCRAAGAAFPAPYPDLYLHLKTAHRAVPITRRSGPGPMAVQLSDSPAELARLNFTVVIRCEKKPAADYFHAGCFQAGDIQNVHNSISLADEC